MKLESTLVGVAGEYYVAAELTRRGNLASITLRNSRGIDILCSNAGATYSISIQVKTSAGSQPEWILDKKAESYYSEAHFYVFVLLKSELERPEFYIVQSNVVADYVRESHAAWLKGTKRDGSPHKDSAVRKFADYQGKYKEAWSSLGLQPLTIRPSGQP